MKKMTLIILVTIFSLSQLSAQTFSEWFSQKKTQIKYLGQQIAALHVYAGYLEKGYGIARDGLNAIGDLKSGEFTLHKDYFGSLKKVSPAIKNYAKVGDIISLQLGILKQYKQAVKKVKTSGWFSRHESDYVAGVFTNLTTQCAATVNELIRLTTNGELQMNDDERLSRIDALQRDMQDKAAFTQSFCNDINLLAAQRSKQQTENSTLKQSYGLSE